MKSFKMIAYQAAAMLSIEFKLNEKQAPDNGKIVGTAINDLYRKLDAAKVFGARVFDSREPINIRIENKETGRAVDSALLDEGVTGVKTSFTDKLKLNSSDGSKARFAKKIWEGYNLLTIPVQVKHIQVVIAERELQQTKVMAARQLDANKLIEVAEVVA